MTSPDEGRLIQANGISVYDWGAAVAWLTAITRPDRVRTLTAISAGDHYLDGERVKKSAAFVNGPWRYEEIPGACHWVPLDAPERLNELLLDWLRQ